MFTRNLQPTKQVVQSTGYSEYWICTIVQRYNADGIGDRRHANPGAAALDLLTPGHLTYTFTPPSIRPRECYNLPVAWLQRYKPITSSGLGFDPLFER